MRADARRNYEALVATARELFLEQGPDAPMDEVAKRAGVGAGTLYRHFPTRNDLISAVYVSDIETLCDSAEKLAAEPDPGVTLAEFVELYLSFSMRSAGLKKAIREMLAAESPQAPSVSVCKSRMMDLTQELLERAQVAGAARRDIDPMTLLRMIHGMALSCEDSPEMAPAMLQVMKDGLLKAA